MCGVHRRGVGHSGLRGARARGNRLVDKHRTSSSKNKRKQYKIDDVFYEGAPVFLPSQAIALAVAGMAYTTYMKKTKKLGPSSPHPTLDTILWANS